ncbi:hypothetical protein ACFZDK_31950 [Streptomyces sp. NPDC007901]|uniref:hypothetical protein n=1 Tax=Streptomyces sp. NPDC007901 TaxID=3364785 RepID=UPI0036EE0FA3
MLRHHPRVLLLGIGVGLSAFVFQGTVTTYLISYAVQDGLARQTVLNSLAVSSTLAVGVYASALFPLVDTGSTALLVPRSCSASRCCTR